MMNTFRKGILLWAVLTLLATLFLRPAAVMAQAQSFKDNFDDSALPGWKLIQGAQWANDAGNGVLRLGGGWATQQSYWSNFTMNFRFRLPANTTFKVVLHDEYEKFPLELRFTPTQVSVLDIDNVDGIQRDLGTRKMTIQPTAWHRASITAVPDKVSLSLDGQAVLTSAALVNGYLTNSPIRFAGAADIDDVEIQGSLPATPQPTLTPAPVVPTLPLQSLTFTDRFDDPSLASWQVTNASRVNDGGNGVLRLNGVNTSSHVVLKQYWAGFTMTFRFRLPAGGGFDLSVRNSMNPVRTEVRPDSLTMRDIRGGNMTGYHEDLFGPLKTSYAPGEWHKAELSGLAGDWANVVMTIDGKDTLADTYSDAGYNSPIIFQGAGNGADIDDVVIQGSVRPTGTQPAPGATATVTATARPTPTSASVDLDLSQAIRDKEQVIESLLHSSYGWYNNLVRLPLQDATQARVDAYQEDAARQLLQELKAQGSRANSAAQKTAFLRLLEQEKTLAATLKIYALAADDYGDAAADGVSILSGTVFLVIRATTNKSGALKDLALKSTRDLGVLVAVQLKPVVNTALHAGDADVSEGIVNAVFDYASLQKQDWGTAMDLTEKLINERVLALNAQLRTAELVAQVEPTLNRSVDLVRSASDAAPTTAGKDEVARLQLAGIQSLSSIQQQAAHSIYDQFLKGRQMNDLFRDMADMAAVGAPSLTTVFFSLLTRTFQAEIDAQSMENLKPALACIRTISAQAGALAFNPEQLMPTCPPVEFRVVLGQAAWLDGAAWARIAASLDQHLAGLQGGAGRLQAALQSGDAAELKAANDAWLAAQDPFLADVSAALALLVPPAGQEWTVETRQAAGELVRLEGDLLAADLAADQLQSGADPTGSRSALDQAVQKIQADLGTARPAVGQVAAQAAGSARPAVALSAAPSELLGAAGVPLTVMVSVQNVGSAASTAAVITGVLGEKEILSAAVGSLAPGETRPVQLSFTPPTAGEFLLHLLVREGDRPASAVIRLNVQAEAAGSPPLPMAGLLILGLGVLFVGFSLVMLLRRRR